MKFDFGAAYSGLTADAAHIGAARVVTLDSKTFRDGELVHVHFKRAAFPTVEREEASLQREPGKTDSTVSKGEIILTSL